MGAMTKRHDIPLGNRDGRQVTGGRAGVNA
jgi:hypothetical protein